MRKYLEEKAKKLIGEENWKKGKEIRRGLEDKLGIENWTNIHEGFGKKTHEDSGKTYQQEWEEMGLTYQDAQWWIGDGLNPYKLDYIRELKNLNLTAYEYWEWRKIGLIGLNIYGHIYGHKLAYYCQTKQITPEMVKDNLEQYETEFNEKLEGELKSAQVYVDFFYPLENRSKIKKLNIYGLTGNLDLTGFNNLTELDCSSNKITLNLSDCSALTNLNCSWNKLTNLDFLNNLPAPEKLTKLHVRFNNITSDLTPLSKLVNLKLLDLLENPSLSASLAPLQNCSQLETLEIINTNLTPDLQHLPLSLQNIKCDGKIKEKLALYGNNLVAWQVAHPNLMEQAGKELVIDNSDYNQSELKTITNAPEYLTKQLKQETIQKDNHQQDNLDYSHFTLRDARPFESTIAFELPLRVYNLQTEKIETTVTKTGNYAVLSYVWGQAGELPAEAKQTMTQLWTAVDYNNQINPAGYKSWQKAIAVAKKLGINYLWMDQLCINQHSVAEKNQEVPKMRQYYSNATATLIAIDGSIGSLEKSESELTKRIIEQIFNSPWFTRAWTFQEGLLSKQTIFMFDDGIVDGRILANFWGGVQSGSYTGSINLNTPFIFITPLGWSYGANQEQKVNLGLSQTLAAIAYRQQTVPLDGLYSILGLLPYGHLVKVNYQAKDHKYTQEELNAELRKIMKLAMDNGDSYGSISWLGTRQVGSELWKFPTIKIDGSSEITGSVEFKEGLDSVKISENGWEVFGDNFLAIKDDESKGIKKGDIIIHPNSEQFKSDNRLKIILPVPEKTTRPIIFRSKISGHGGYRSKVFLDMVNKEAIKKELIEQYQQQLPIIQKHAQTREQSFRLVYDKSGKNETFNNSLVWQTNEQYYILDANKQLQEINLWKENAHKDFVDQELIKEWTNNNWIYGEVQMWVKELENKFNPKDYDFYTWVRDIKELDERNIKEVDSFRQEFQAYQTEQETQIQVPPK